eukprot:gene1558-biopygen16826
MRTRICPARFVLLALGDDRVCQVATVVKNHVRLPVAAEALQGLLDAPHVQYSSGSEKSWDFGLLLNGKNWSGFPVNALLLNEN